ncbi:MAG: helix-turn-helix domain-containing protein [Gammaproteobacteria bacterium]|nr:helix-turn-helix domain-containing protein [Gammaproteobacteria bacterium]
MVKQIANSLSLISPKEAVLEFKNNGFGRITKVTVINWVKEKKIVGKKIGGRYYINKKEYLDFLKKKEF